MKIRSKIEREGGTVVKLGETDYHFVPNEKGDHVCEVADADHAAKLLNVPEGFVRYENIEVVEAGGAAPPVIVVRADAVVDAMDMPDRSGPDYNGLTRKQLEQAYFDKFQKKPHPRAKDSTIVEALIGG